MRKIFNIMPDDKFLDFYIEMSEEFIPSQSKYFIFKKKEELTVKAQNPYLEILYNNEDDYLSLLERIDSETILIFHSLKTEQTEFIKRLPENILKIWIFWGFEGYSWWSKKKLISRRSAYAALEPTLLRFLKFNLGRIFRGSKNPSSKYLSLIREMDFCATWIKFDHELAKEINPRIKSLYFNYFSFEELSISVSDEHQLNLNRLLLGNSGDITNNHIEALITLNKKNYAGEVICPLSYGGKKNYLDNLISLGNNLFGKKFIPITDFLPLEEYKRLINSCGIIWMNHKRQQAAGNLFTGFLSEKVIILDERNPLCGTFRDWGLTFFSPTVVTDFSFIRNFDLSLNREILNNRISKKSNSDFFEFLKSQK